MSDVRKERELAEKRKNDPVLNQSQDHLVRKLFSKFKKGGPDALVATERGEGGGGGDLSATSAVTSLINSSSGGNQPSPTSGFDQVWPLTKFPSVGFL